MLLQQLIFISLLSVHYANEYQQNCKSQCFTTGESPSCGAWLLNDNSKKVQGIYQLNEGYLDLTCTVKSLPTPVDINWSYRQEYSTKWEPVSCASLHNQQDCNVKVNSSDTISYQISRSTCKLKTDRLTKTGYYRCQALSEVSIDKSLVLSSEALITVVGIEFVDIVSSSLPYGEPGHVEVEFCANPKPEVVWLAREAVIQPGHSIHRIASLKTLQQKSWKGQNQHGPAGIVPFCYRVRLIIGKVEENDGDISIIIRNEGETRKVPIPLEISNLPKTATRFFSLFKLCFIFITSGLNFLRNKVS